MRRNRDPTVREGAGGVRVSSLADGTVTRELVEAIDLPADQREDGGKGPKALLQLGDPPRRRVFLRGRCRLLKANGQPVEPIRFLRQEARRRGDERDELVVGR